MTDSRRLLFIYTDSVLTDYPLQSIVPIVFKQLSHCLFLDPGLLFALMLLLHHFLLRHLGLSSPSSPSSSPSPSYLVSSPYSLRHLLLLLLLLFFFTSSPSSPSSRLRHLRHLRLLHLSSPSSHLLIFSISPSSPSSPLFYTTAGIL